LGTSSQNLGEEFGEKKGSDSLEVEIRFSLSRQGINADFIRRPRSREAKVRVLSIRGGEENSPPPLRDRVLLPIPSRIAATL